MIAKTGFSTNDVYRPATNYIFCLALFDHLCAYILWHGCVVCREFRQLPDMAFDRRDRVSCLSSSSRPADHPLHGYSADCGNNFDELFNMVPTCPDSPLGNLAFRHPAACQLGINCRDPATDSVSTQQYRIVAAIDRAVDLHKLVVSQSAPNYQHSPVLVDDVSTAASELSTQDRSVTTTNTVPALISENLTSEICSRSPPYVIINVCYIHAFYEL